MQELSQYIPYLGMALIGGWVVSFNPKVMEYVTKAKDFVKAKLPTKKTPTIPIDETADLSEALQYLSVHELLDELMARAEGDADTDGLMLLGAYGKHVYDLRLEPKKPATKTTKKGA